MEIGEELRRRREARGLSLREVEEATKIRMKYLIALEAEDFEALPGKVYVIGFLRTYARFLDMDDTELVQAVKARSRFSEEIEDEPVHKKKQTSPKANSYLIFAIVIALIIGGLSFAFLRDKDEQTPAEPAPQTQTPQEEKEEEPQKEIPQTPEQEDPNAGNEAQINGVSVTVIVKEASCWMDVKIDGKNEFNGTLSAGESRTFNGTEKVTIKYGNAGAVEAIVNGKSIYPLGKLGQVITAEYTEEN